MIERPTKSDNSAQKQSEGGDAGQHRRDMEREFQPFVPTTCRARMHERGLPSPNLAPGCLAGEIVSEVGKQKTRRSGCDAESEPDKGACGRNSLALWKRADECKQRDRRAAVDEHDHLQGKTSPAMAAAFILKATSLSWS